MRAIPSERNQMTKIPENEKLVAVISYNIVLKKNWPF